MQCRRPLSRSICGSRCRGVSRRRRCMYSGDKEPRAGGGTIPGTRHRHRIICRSSSLLGTMSTFKCRFLLLSMHDAQQAPLAAGSGEQVQDQVVQQETKPCSKNMPVQVQPGSAGGSSLETPRPCSPPDLLPSKEETVRTARMRNWCRNRCRRRKKCKLGSSREPGLYPYLLLRQTTRYHGHARFLPRGLPLQRAPPGTWAELWRTPVAGSVTGVVLAS